MLNDVPRFQFDILVIFVKVYLRTSENNRILTFHKYTTKQKRTRIIFICPLCIIFFSSHNKETAVGSEQLNMENCQI